MVVSISTDFWLYPYPRKVIWIRDRLGRGMPTHQFFKVSRITMNMLLVGFLYLRRSVVRHDPIGLFGDALQEL